MQEKKGGIALLIIISLFVGAISGVLGSFFLKPYLERTDWGKSFLQMNLAKQIEDSDLNKIYSVTEDSATIDAVSNASDSVVSIVITKDIENIYNLTGPDALDYYFLGNGVMPEDLKGKQQIGGGTGFVVDANGLILTNRHVVDDEEADYTVVLSNGETYSAEVLGRDKIQDIAILKIEASNLKPLILGDSDNLHVGQTVIAIGNALSEYDNTVTKGIISGLNRRIVTGIAEVLDKAIQTDAAINLGNSGGPLVNLSGEVIGINTAINANGSSLSFAIPVNQAKNIIESVKEFGKIVRPWLGVRYVNLDEATAEKNNIKYDYGALILPGINEQDYAVVPDSPADKAGLVENDIILEVNGEKITLENPLINIIAKYKVGDEVELKVYHDNAEKMLKLVLAERQDIY